MHRPSIALVFLALFTTVEKAAEIEGDLLEQSRVHGRLWFLMQLLLTSAALFRQTLLQQPLLILLPGYAVYELVFKLNFWVIRPLQRHLRFQLDYPAEPVLIGTRIVWIICGYLIGMALVRYLPKTGMYIVIVAVTLGMARVLMLNEVTSIEALLYFVLPILLGGFHGKSTDLYKQQKTENLISR